MATHVPVQNIHIRKKWDSKSDKIMSEEQVFNKYVLNSENNHQFVIVIGSSGAGKSHLIRWFAARLDQAALENEVVLFVRRSDNSLKGTIKQLLELPEVANIPNKAVYDRLVRATSTIDNKKLKDMIYQNFIVEIRNDENDEILSNNEKKRLIELLQYEQFQLNLMKEEGAIDRIYQKVAENETGDSRDVMALFETRDFEVDVNFCDDMIANGAAKNAKKMADAILADDEMPERLSDYMNTLVNRVIQTCAGLEPGDFEQVFVEIRKEIKRQGKNLTLLIEDVTAFTGVNVALLNVLTTEHTGMYENQELCRISSIVGTTEKYFNVNFMDNHKDRVTQFFYIPNDVFGENQNSLYEFVGRYLNAMSLRSDVLKGYIFDKEMNIRLQNDSVGTYISADKSGLLKIDIKNDKDVYNQQDAFKTAYSRIDMILAENDRFREFKDKLQKCTLLVLIKDMESINSDAVEQIFLDINEKSKRLDNASIFKGYCFKIYDESFQDDLKCLWIRLKKAYISFKRFSGKNYRFDEYIYTYLLVTENENMTENLSPGGRHFLEDKNMDDVERILTQMVEYGERVSDFYDCIQNDTYMFEDICVDSNSYKTASKKLITNIKEYLLYSMEIKSAQYQKVPLNWFIYFVKEKSNNINILMKDFMAITANLYIYSFLFTLSSSKKSKKNIDHSLYNVLNENAEIKQVIDIVKSLRKNQVENVRIPEQCSSFEVLANLYTIMDCFKVKDNRFDLTYHNHGEQLYTLEHFIIPDNRNAKVKWISKDGEVREISFTGQSDRKKKLTNYLIIRRDLNNDILLDYDVVKKIELISKYYGHTIPKHIQIIISHIENMEVYKELKKIKDEEDIEIVKGYYNKFLDDYFSDDNQRIILSKLLDALKSTFINS